MEEKREQEWRMGEERHGGGVEMGKNREIKVSLKYRWRI